MKFPENNVPMNIPAPIARKHKSEVRLSKVRINLLKNDRQAYCDTVHDGIVCSVEGEKDDK